MIFFTADTHFRHWELISGIGRPFRTTELHDNTLVKNWNSRVKMTDTVYVLGDFAFKKDIEGNVFQYYKSRLSGDIIFIKGNHDANNQNSTPLVSCVLYYGGKTIKLMHNPQWAECKYDLNLCGHVHNQFKFKQEKGCIICNVGVDVWNYMPINIGEILGGLSKWRKENEK